MRIEETNNLTIVYPDEGMMLTNGDIITDMIFLGDADSVDNWHEVPIEEVDAINQEDE